jgi:2-octaprenylphenol hydroxylase
LLDAATLSEVIIDAGIKGRDIGAFYVLRRYERWRKGDNLLVMAVMDGFKRLFGSSFAPLRILRNAGLDITNSLLPVKARIIEHAMGLKGDLPRLARP